MNSKVFAVVLLAACSVPASFGANVSITDAGFLIGGRPVTCPDNNFGSVTTGDDLNECKCADGSTCTYADEGPADDKESPLPGVPQPLLPGVPDPSPKPSPTPSPTPSPSSASSMAALSAVATVAVLGHLL